MPKDNITVKIHDGTINNVDRSTKSSVQSAISKIKKTFVTGFFDDINVHITSDFSNLPNSGSALNNYLRENESLFSFTKGITSDDSQRKEIFIQESAFLKDKIANLFSFDLSFNANNEIEQATLHEFGHLYDSYGGDNLLMQKHQELINKYYDVQFEEIQATPEEEKIMKEYIENNGFSDGDDFKKALGKDLKNLRLTSSVTNKYGYLLGEFYNRGLDVKPNEEDIQAAEASRSEIFAQLFSYILGGDDGNKEQFLKMFPNACNVVKGCINSYKH